MVLGAPYFLIGFAALVVPIIIHLWSKNTRSSLSFGSLRFLKETETRTMRSIMPSQWLLLFLRLLIVSLLVLILTEPRTWTEQSSKVDRRYIIDPAYADHLLIQQLRDTLSNADQVKWLASGFPNLDEAIPNNSMSFWSLLSQTEEENAEETIVISPLRAIDFWGMRRSFPVEYSWMQLPTDPEVKAGIQFVQQGQSFQLNSTYTTNQSSHDWQKNTNAEPLVITYSIEASKKYAEYHVMTQAAISTLNELGPVLLKEVSMDQASWLFWFSDQPVPTNRRSVSIDSPQVTAWIKLSNDRVTLSSNWTREMAVQEQFPKRLLRLIAEDLTEDRNELLAMNPAVFTYDLISDNPMVKQWQEVSNWIWMILLVVLVSERYVAFKSERK